MLKKLENARQTKNHKSVAYIVIDVFQIDHLERDYMENAKLQKNQSAQHNTLRENTLSHVNQLVIHII